MPIHDIILGKIVRLCILDSKVMQESTGKNEPYGLGGWLILFQIHLIYNIGVAMHNCYFIVFKVEFTSIYVLQFLLLAVLVICLILFYSRRKLFLIFYLAAWVFGLANLFLNVIVNKNFNDLIRGIMRIGTTTLIIGAVFTFKRVKNTFK